LDAPNRVQRKELNISGTVQWQKIWLLQVWFRGMSLDTPGMVIKELEYIWAGSEQGVGTPDAKFSVRNWNTTGVVKRNVLGPRFWLRERSWDSTAVQRKVEMAHRKYLLEEL
jgi:hypothetical protein